MAMLDSSLLKLGLPLVGSAFALIRFRRHEVLASALKLPTFRAATLWAAIYLAWMLLTDAAFGWRGPWDFDPWRAAPLASSVIRVLAVVLAGPLLEELIFRGLAFGFLLKTRLGGPGAIVVTALVWSLLHWNYSPLVIGIIFVQGLILGLARWKSGSVYLPIFLHILWNLYAIW